MIRITNPRRFITFLVFVVVVIFVINFFGSGKILRSGEVTITNGMAAKKVWSMLAHEGYTHTTWPWRYWDWRLKAAPKIKAGAYDISKGENAHTVIERFITGQVSSHELSITYPEGFTVDQMAARTAAQGIGTADDFKKAANPTLYSEQYPYLADLPAGRTLEGYLFPDTYHVDKNDKPEDVIRRMLGNFDQKLTPDLRAEIKAQNRTIDQVIIMASIIEREVINTDDMATVSGVLWKRVDNGAGLAVDASVRFALNKWDAPLTYQDLQTDSPYNTRKWKGLPPGPISNPGLQAIIAAIRPMKTDYYYYLSTPEGKTVFAKTNDEHNANKAKYLR
jgi:UPF0755 protein